MRGETGLYGRASSDDVGQKRIGVVNDKWVTKPSGGGAAARFDNYTFARRRLRTRACHRIVIKRHAISRSSTGRAMRTTETKRGGKRRKEVYARSPVR